MNDANMNIYQKLAKIRKQVEVMKRDAKGYDVSIGESTNILSYADFDKISEWAIPAMQWGCGSGVITGVTESTLEPAGTTTRAQGAAMLMRFVESVK